MGKMMTRKEAADMLGISDQSVSNWIKEGILNGKVTKKSTLVDKDSVTKFFDTLQEIAQMEKTIAETKKRLQEEQDGLQRALTDFRHAHAIYNLAGEDNIRVEFLEAVLTGSQNAGIISQREFRIVNAILHKVPLDDIVKDDWSGRANIMSIAHKAIRRIAKMANYAALQEDLESAKKRIDLADELIRGQQAEIDELNRQLDVYRQQEAEKKAEEERENETDEEILNMRRLLKTKMTDLSLSFRCLKALKSYDIETLGDAVQYNKTDYLKIRNFGKKSLNEIDDLFDSLGLSFGMDVSKYIKKGAKLEYESYATHS